LRSGIGIPPGSDQQHTTSATCRTDSERPSQPPNNQA
jgi:hypothetical protein